MKKHLKDLCLIIFLYLISTAVFCLLVYRFSYQSAVMAVLMYNTTMIVFLLIKRWQDEK